MTANVMFLSPQHFKYECSCQSRLYGKRDWLLEDDEAEMTIGAVLNRCYTMNDEGIEYQLSCVEGYRAGKLKSIECDEHEIKFHPEQLFLRSPSPASRDVDMFPKDDYKDSFVIAHGKCRVLSY